MKRLLLTWTAFLVLAASGSAANATLFDFTFTGSLITFIVPRPTHTGFLRLAPKAEAVLFRAESAEAAGVLRYVATFC